MKKLVCLLIIAALMLSACAESAPAANGGDNSTTTTTTPTPNTLPSPPTEQELQLAVIEQFYGKMNNDTAANFQNVINAGFPDDYRIGFFVDLAPLSPPSGDVCEGVSEEQAAFVEKHMPDATIKDGSTGRDGSSQLRAEAALTQILSFLALDEVLFLQWSTPYLYGRGQLFIPTWNDIYFDFDTKQAALAFETTMWERYTAKRLEAAISGSAQDIANHGNGVIVPDSWLVTPPWEDPETLAMWESQFQESIKSHAYTGAFQYGHVLVRFTSCAIGQCHPVDIGGVTFRVCESCREYIFYTADGEFIPLAEAYDDELISTDELSQVQQIYEDKIEITWSRIISGADIWN